LQTSDADLFTFYIPLANIDLPEYYLVLVAGRLAASVAALGWRCCVTQSKFAPSFWAPELCAVVSLAASRFGAFLVGSNSPARG